MGREDQIEEREVLDSIFPEEITGEIDTAWSFDSHTMKNVTGLITILRPI